MPLILEEFQTSSTRYESSVIITHHISTCIQIDDLTSFITAVAISPTGAYIACGDADGIIHMKSQIEGDEIVPLNGFEGRQVEWANPPEPLPELEWTDSTYVYSWFFECLTFSSRDSPLNSIGLPHYTTRLLSAWSPQFSLSKTVSYPPPPKIPSQILNTMKMNDNVAYAPLPKELRGRRNMIILEKKKMGGWFRSGKSGLGEVGVIVFLTDTHDSFVSRLNRKRLYSITPEMMCQRYIIT